MAKIAKLFAVGIAAVVVVACSDEETGAPQQSSAAPSAVQEDMNEVFTRTVVHRNDDGTESVKRVSITRAQQLADQAERQRHLEALAHGEPVPRTIDRDTACDTSVALYLYDQTGEMGDELCIYSDVTYPDFAYLGDYTRKTVCVGATGGPVTLGWWGRNCITTFAGFCECTSGSQNFVESIWPGFYQDGQFTTTDSAICSNGYNTEWSAMGAASDVTPTGAYVDFNQNGCTTKP